MITFDLYLIFEVLGIMTHQVIADSIINNGVTVRINDPMSSNQAKIKEQNYDNNRYTVQF